MQISWRIKHKDRSDVKIGNQIYNDVVTHVHWECKAFDDSIEETISGTVPFTIHPIEYTSSSGIPILIPSEFDTENYIPYNDITDEVMLQWAKNFLGQDEVNRIENVVTQKYNNDFIPNQK